MSRFVAIKDLGFTLEQVRTILDDKVSAEEPHGMVRLRRAQLESQISADLAREVYLHCPDNVDEWVTELQMQVASA